MTATALEDMTFLAVGKLVGGQWIVVDCRNSLEAEMDAILADMPVAVRADVALGESGLYFPTDEEYAEEWDVNNAPGYAEAQPSI